MKNKTNITVLYCLLFALLLTACTDNEYEPRSPEKEDAEKLVEVSFGVHVDDNTKIITHSGGQMVETRANSPGIMGGAKENITSTEWNNEWDMRFIVEVWSRTLPLKCILRQEIYTDAWEDDVVFTMSLPHQVAYDFLFWTDIIPQQILREDVEIIGNEDLMAYTGNSDYYYNTCNKGTGYFGLRGVVIRNEAGHGYIGNTCTRDAFAAYKEGLTVYANTPYTISLNRPFAKLVFQATGLPAALTGSDAIKVKYYTPMYYMYNVTLGLAEKAGAPFEPGYATEALPITEFDPITSTTTQVLFTDYILVNTGESFPLSLFVGEYTNLHKGRWIDYNIQIEPNTVVVIKGGLRDLYQMGAPYPNNSAPESLICWVNEYGNEALLMHPEGINDNHSTATSWAAALPVAGDWHLPTRDEAKRMFDPDTGISSFQLGTYNKGVESFEMHIYWVFLATSINVNANDQFPASRHWTQDDNGPGLHYSYTPATIASGLVVDDAALTINPWGDGNAFYARAVSNLTLKGQ